MTSIFEPIEPQKTIQPQPVKPKKIRVTEDCWDAILNDKWMYIITWGQPRTGKSTFNMNLGYNIYKDWDQVLGCFVFQLAGLLHNMREGIPCRIMTRNKLHDRVPLLIGDDWGANSNKAKTQHEKAWDLVKGAWDTYGTKLAVFLANMNQPDEMTLQLCNKYTHEIYLPSRGTAKYDKIDWEQNYNGWQPRHDKDWQQTFKFKAAPLDVYKQYDEMRMALVDELDILIQDAIVETEAERVIKRATAKDVELLETLNLKGMLSKDFFNNPDRAELKESLKKAKAKGLVTTVRKGTNYWYDLTRFGEDILDTITKINTDPEDLKRAIKRTDQQNKKDKQEADFKN